MNDHRPEIATALDTFIGSIPEVLSTDSDEALDMMTKHFAEAIAPLLAYERMEAVKGAEVICKIYFDIGADAIGEDKVRELCKEAVRKAAEAERDRRRKDGPL